MFPAVQAQHSSSTNTAGVKCHINELMSVDLMRELFTQLTSMDNMLATYPFLVPRATRAPMSLTSVCSRWRQIAIDTPGLWSSLSIDAEELLAPESKKRDLYRLWLDRCWGTPVSLSILDVRPSRAAELKDAVWLDFLMTHIPYWSYLSAGPYVINEFIRGLGSMPPGAARHLEALAGVFSPEAPFLNDRSIPITSIFPRLAQLDISATSHHGLTDINLRQLTHLSCDIRFFEELFASTNVKTLEFPNLLELCVHRDILIEGDASTLIDPFDRSFPPYVVNLPELRFLKVFDNDATVGISRIFLPICNAPILEILQINNMYMGAQFTHPTSTKAAGDFGFLLNFLKQSPCLRFAIIRHQYFLTTAFLKHPEISKLDYVHAASPPAGPAYRTLDRARNDVGNMWKAEGLDVNFSVAADDSILQTYIGWSRVPNEPLGLSFLPRTWPASVWDRNLYAQYVRRNQGLRLVSC